MGIEAPIPVSNRLRDFNNVFLRIVSAAEHPHLSIPETEAGKSRKQYHRLVNRSLMCVSGKPVQFVAIGLLSSDSFFKIFLEGSCDLFLYFSAKRCFSPIECGGYYYCAFVFEILNLGYFF